MTFEPRSGAGLRERFIPEAGRSKAGSWYFGGETAFGIHHSDFVAWAPSGATDHRCYPVGCWGNHRQSV